MYRLVKSTIVNNSTSILNVILLVCVLYIVSYVINDSGTHLD